MSLEDRQADAYGLIDECIRVAQEPRKSDIQKHFKILNDAFREAYELDDEDDGDRAYDAVESLEEYAEELREEFEDVLT